MIKLLAILLPLVALIGGAATGHFLMPEPVEEEVVEPIPEAPDLSAPEIFQMRDPFVVPVLRDGRVWSHVVLSLGVETFAIPREDVITMEPRLRDGLNEALFLHASLGGFDGDFTAAISMNRLRTRLNSVVTGLLDDPDGRVLIISMARQNG